MPTVWIDRDEAERDDLPPVCLRCGDDATVTKTRTFSWYPPWVTLLVLISPLIWIIVAVILTKRMILKAPVCDRHAGHWFRFNLFAYGGLLGTLAVLFGGIVLAVSGNRQLEDLGLAVVIAGGVGFIVVLIVAAVWQLNTIRAVEITDDDMKLTGVCEEFRQALREQRRAERDADDQRRSRRRDGR